MKKISTLFVINYNDGHKGEITPYIREENSWVTPQTAIPTRKWNGAAHCIINGELYKRYDVKNGKSVPLGAIPCQEPDSITGHHPHWVKCNRKDDKYPFEAFDKLKEYYSSEAFSDRNDLNQLDGTYELCGEKVQGNPEKVKGHALIKHGQEVLDLKDFSFESIKLYLSNPFNDIEGIVFHEINGDRMCKIRKTDFGFIR